MIENFSLRPYQLSQLFFHMTHERSLNLSAPGTGKTPVACLYINYLIEQKQCKVAFVMPKSLLMKNYQELLNFTNLKEEDLQIVTGNPPAKRQSFYDNPNIKVFLMGFDNFSNEWEKLPSEIGGLVIDEVHMGYKTDSSKRTQSFYRAMRKIRYFLGMTGTLIDGRLNSAYPMIRVINPNYYFSYNQFMAIHGVYDWDGNLVGWRNHERLSRILSNHAVAIRFQDAYKDSPKPVIISELCQIDKKHKELYQTMEEQALIELEDGYLDATDSGGVKQLRCRQILAAPESVEIKEQFTLGKDETLKVYLEDAQNNKKPLIIFSVFRAEQDRIANLCREYGFTVELMNGSTTDKNRARIDKEFREGKIDIVIGSPEVMSVGFNWQHVDTVIFVSLDYKDSNFKQALQRADRGTRTYPLRVIRLYYDVAVEHRIWEIIKRKSKDSEKVGW